MKRICLVYLCYGNLRHLPQVVSSLAELTYPKEKMTVVMVPAGSPDGIAEAIRRDVLPRSGKDLPEIILMDDGENRGFAGNNNHAIRWALEQGFDGIFLHNGDLYLDPEAITKLVHALDSDPKIAAAQSLICYWNDHEKVNVSGGMVHVAGYGFARDNEKSLADIAYPPISDIVYSSGAATLYRAEALKEVGLLEEGFFMYHEDLELGLRLRIAGWRNVLVGESLAFHDYQFSRNPKKFAWMELYRWIVILGYLRFRTLILLAPLLFCLEIGSWLMSLKGAWVQAKVWALREWFNPRTWLLLSGMRLRAQRLRKISDRELMELFTGKIEGQETSGFLMERVVNPLIDRLWRAHYFLIRW